MLTATGSARAAKALCFLAMKAGDTNALGSILEEYSHTEHADLNLFAFERAYHAYRTGSDCSWYLSVIPDNYAPKKARMALKAQIAARHGILSLDACSSLLDRTDGEVFLGQLAKEQLHRDILSWHNKACTHFVGCEFVECKEACEQVIQLSPAEEQQKASLPPDVQRAILQAEAMRYLAGAYLEGFFPRDRALFERLAADPALHLRVRIARALGEVRPDVWDAERCSKVWQAIKTAVYLLDEIAVDARKAREARETVEAVGAPTSGSPASGALEPPGVDQTSVSIEELRQIELLAQMCSAFCGGMLFDGAKTNSQALRKALSPQSIQRMSEPVFISLLLQWLCKGTIESPERLRKQKGLPQAAIAAKRCVATASRSLGSWSQGLRCLSPAGRVWLWRLLLRAGNAVAVCKAIACIATAQENVQNTVSDVERSLVHQALFQSQVCHGALTAAECQACVSLVHPACCSNTGSLPTSLVVLSSTARIPHISTVPAPIVRVPKEVPPGLAGRWAKKPKVHRGKKGGAKRATGGHQGAVAESGDVSKVSRQRKGRR